MDLGLGEREFLELHYASDAKLFVPVAQLHVISRYSGADPDAAPLHTLGSGQWGKAKRKAAEQARDTAAELLALYAVRAARAGSCLHLPGKRLRAVRRGVRVQETAPIRPLPYRCHRRHAQRQTHGSPGLRRCRLWQDGSRTCVLPSALSPEASRSPYLCPTTLLCEQHYQTFCDRFADWPVNPLSLVTL